MPASVSAAARPSIVCLRNSHAYLLGSNDKISQGRPDDHSVEPSYLLSPSPLPSLGASPSTLSRTGKTPRGRARRILDKRSLGRARVGFPAGWGAREAERETPCCLPAAWEGSQGAPLFIPMLPRDPISPDSGVIASDGWAAIV